MKTRERYEYSFFTTTTATPLHVAVEHSQVRIVEYLLRVGADVDKEDSSGRTPLDVAGYSDEVWIYSNVTIELY